MRYEPEDSSLSPRFCGIRTFMRLPHVTDLQNADFAIVGVPFDTGASFRVGSRFAPEAIRGGSVLLRPCDLERGINIFDYLSGIDYGDLTVVPGFIEDTYQRITTSLKTILDTGVIPVLIGGDHSISLPILRAMADKHGPVGLLHFDSHSDTWDKYYGHRYFHGTPFLRAFEENLIAPEKTIQIGMRGGGYNTRDRDFPKSLGFDVITTRQLMKLPHEEVISRINERLQNTKTYLSFDIDILDPAFAPGTGTPEIGGPNTFQILEILRGLQGINFTGFDLVEVLPAFDHGGITSLAAAGIIFEFLSLLAYQKKQG